MVKPLDQMYEAHHGMVFRTAYRITGNAADAEDVLQTVFLRIVRLKIPTWIIRKVICGVRP